MAQRPESNDSAIGKTIEEIDHSILTSIRRLQKITSTPKRINDVFRGSFPVSLAANGAATNPPIINATIVCQ